MTTPIQLPNASRASPVITVSFRSFVQSSFASPVPAFFSVGRLAVDLPPLLGVRKLLKHVAELGLTVGPNDDTDWVEGEGDCVPIQTWFIHQAGLRFPLSRLLKVVLSMCQLTFMQVSMNFMRTVLVVDALMQRERLEFTAEDLLHIYCVVRPRKDFETHMFKGNHYLRLRKPSQPQTRLVNDPDLYSVLRHRGYVPIGKPILPTLRIREQAPKPSSLLLDEDIDWGDKGGDNEAEVEDGEEVYQVPVVAPSVLIPVVALLVQPPAAKPILIPSSDSDTIDDFGIVEAREVVKHSFGQGSSSSSSRGREEKVMAPKVRTLRSTESAKHQDFSDPVLSNPAKDQTIAPSSLSGGKWKGR
ncbi:hypothetical protein Acr_00g0038170 [Actinidia rufa]|uniref:Uncharacterized protein n=1 Tax=Actinidia rufa TaxID=165716 RepID=A0A7J0DHG1_9ERIC|nr:hypothetical protein Acr_00g0038170 [Actinidia rufa]